MRDLGKFDCGSCALIGRSGNFGDFGRIGIGDKRVDRRSIFSIGELQRDRSVRLNAERACAARRHHQAQFGRGAEVRERIQREQNRL